MKRSLALLALVLVAVGTASLALAARGTVRATFTKYGFSLRYPAGWTRVKWCWSGMHEMPIAVLTTAQQAPTCTPPAVGVGASFPPPESLGAGEMSLYISQFFYPLPPGSKSSWNARIGGRPARVARPVYGDEYDTAVTCPAGTRREYRFAAVERPHGAGTVIKLEALMCGPGLAGEGAQFRRVLDSLRFNR